MPRLVGGSEVPSQNTGGMKAQLSAMFDAMRQLIGNANIVGGSGASTDPLTPPFTLYVNPYIGRDTFAAGTFNSFESSGTDEEKIAQKLKRLSNQQMTCGYSPNAPFRTINRAIIEAAIVTSRDYFTFSDPRAQVDCVLIRLSPGRHIVYNQPGNTVGAVTPAEWADGFVPTVNHLIAFNPNEGGLIVPRAASFNGDDLRKCVLSPDYVPAVADEAADYSNRSCILRPTPLALGGQFTFVDKIGATTSHHLLDCFAYVSESQLNAFYDKVYTSCGTGANLGEALMVARPTEYNTVGEFAGSPDATWDTTASASPYIFNASIRSDYGLCGIFADGDKVGGLKSLVTAQFTGVALQKDISCWEVYADGNWRTPTNYAELVSASPDDTRKKPARRSWHITAINDAFIQGVSEFNVGQEGCRTDIGGEITLTNSNSSFGGCAGLSTGYKRAAFPYDQNWAVSRVVTPVSPSAKVGNIRKIQLGRMASFNTSPNRLTLETGLAFDPANPSQPSILRADGYTLRSGTQIWIENPSGPDYRATLSASAWSSSNPDRILVSATPVDSASGIAVPLVDLVGKRVYIRRLADTRSPSERRCSLEITNSASSRIPERNFVLQTDPGRAGGAISRVLNTTSELLMVTSAGAISGSGVRDANITIRRGAPSVVYAADTYYPAGAVVRHANKHWQRLVTGVSVGSDPDPAEWGETLVHMPTAYNAEESRLNESLIITFDTDTATDEASTTLGIDWSTVFSSAGAVRDIYRASVDYRGVHAFLMAMGLSESNAHTALLPRSAATRKLDPTSSGDFPTAPSGGAASGRGNWAIEFRRPSVLRMYGHAWEWAGFGGYSKALPKVQQTLSTYNKFTYYFTSANGGRVVPTGSNEDGFAVSSRGLEDIETGAQLSVNNLDSAELNPPTQLNDLSVENLTVSGQFDVSGVSEFTGGESIAARTDRLGVGRLASTAQLTAIGSGAPTAGDDDAVNAQPDLVTIGGLNRWRQAQRLVSSNTDTITIFVKAGSTDRDLNSMLDNPPTSAALAVPTLARAAEYANTVIGAGNQTADIRIAPGLYDPTSVWQCSVRLDAYNADLTALQFPSNIDGDAVVENNYFDGSGYGDLTNRVNFITFTVNLQKSASSGSNINVNVIGRQMRFARGARFRGGFHFLGLPELIKLVNAGTLAAATFVTGTDPLPSGAFTSDTVANSDTFLNQLRVTNSLTGTYIPWTTTSPLRFDGSRADVVELFDCMFGPVFPSRKDSASVQSAPYIATNDAVQLRIANIYLRGNVVITSAGTGITAAVLNSGQAHYGTTSVATPWTWRQFHHTFIGPATDGPQSVFIQSLGGRRNALYTAGDSTTRTWFKNNTKYLPNHIHLLDSTGAEPSDTTNGPFLDQFIHAYGGLSIGQAFRTGAVTAAFASPVTEGFVGKFGANGYNTVKTRGVLLGNAQNLSDERGSVVFLQPGTTTSLLPAYAANSIFKLAGVTGTNVLNSVPAYVQPATVTAGSFVVARQYEIVTAGTTNFTLIGAADSNVGTVFTATGAGTGTGTARPTGYGQPVTVGPSGRRYNQVITTESNNGNGAALGLNVALVSYARGISPEHGLSITPNVVI